VNRHAAILLGCLAAGGAAGATPTPLRPFEASYAFIWNGITAGVSTFSLSQEAAQQWTYVSKNQPHGLARLYSKASWTLTSRMNIGPEGVRPLLYTATDPDDGASEGEVHFDWDANRATGVADGKKFDMSLRPGVQDDLSMQIALIYALSNDQAPKGISVFDVTGIRDYDFERVGAETLHTPVGDVATIIYRSHKANSPRSNRYWCAPAYGYVPVQVEQQNKGDVAWTLKLRSIHRD
jgi:Protein of unknown function (DUF3108)